MPRKKPFSGKQKKLQLQEKRERKAGSLDQDPSQSKWKSSQDSSSLDTLKKTNFKSYSKDEYDPRRYHLNFLRETKEEIDKRKHDAQTIPITHVPETELEVDIKDIYQPGSVLDMPKRPKWKYGMSKEQLEQKEENYFKDYLSHIHETFTDKNLSYFEHNLETWRQAWRVTEMSDIVVMVTDVRHPVLHFSPALYDHVVKDLGKPLILALNKIDLVPPSLTAAWTLYFKKLFPHLHVVWFTSFPQDVRTVDLGKKLKTRRKPKKRVYTTQIGPKELLETCQEICGDKVDLSSWAVKIERDLEKLGLQEEDSSANDGAGGGDAADDGRDNKMLSQADEDGLEGISDFSDAVTENAEKLSIDDGILTLGFVGHPNVGKSSLMNGLIGHKVVSTSVTPGHTKYFQTYFLTKTVKLCDSPGLVFPSLIPKQLQILSGIYPVAQVQEPYTPVGFLAARIPLVQMLRLEHPNEAGEEVWTPWDVSEAWANKRNFRTAKAARPDVYRAANSILRMAVDGRLCLYMRPPGYLNDIEYWKKHKNTQKLIELQSAGSGGTGLSRETKSQLDVHNSGFSSKFDFSEDLSDDDTDDPGEETDSEDDDDDDEHDDLHVMSNKFGALASIDSG